ncbi:MAG: M50 family metallopeptidase [Candidatus Tectomicrobia bacterium]|nr:M50 family metallopeptidase [Candidatus Tectomicrobia bacterium]
MTSVSDRGKLNLHRLALFLIVAGVSLFFWLSPLLAPFKIFVVFIHETGHALATVLTGGRVLSMVVTPWESGYVQHAGGSPLVVASAGYVGSAVFGGMMMWLSGRVRWTQMIFAGLALLFGIVTILFVRNGFGVVFGLGTAVAFGVLAWKSIPGAAYLIDILAVMSSLYALYDLSDFLLIGARTDAAILAQITYIPAFVWAILWSGISLIVVFVAGKKALTRP